MESFRLLPDDCWEMIINNLDIEVNPYHLDKLSLVSNQLLLVTNQLLPSLKVFDRTKIALHVYFTRFPNLKMIDLSEFSEEITPLLYDLAHSDLDLHGLDLSNQKALPIEDLKEIASRKKNFRILICSRLSTLRDHELIAIADEFPLLEEIDISYPAYASAITDQTIEALSKKLPNLSKINLSGNSSLSNECLQSLSSNCGKLKDVILHHAGSITQDGILFLLKNSPNLATLSLALPEGIFSTIPMPFAGLKFLLTIELFYMHISDSLLFQIADSKIPLKKFALCHCKEFTFTGFLYFLHTYDSLESIALADVDFLNDAIISFFSKFFRRMSTIKLNCCPKLTVQAFYTLLEACPQLENLEMAKTGLGDYNPRDLSRVNPKCNSLYLSSSRLQGEENMKTTSFGPNLRYLNLSGCIYLNKGIIQILGNCKNIRHLKINGCQNTSEVESTSKFERLEILEAIGSAMSNRSLSMFARRSPKLRRVNLKYCYNITAEGVKELLENCEQLIDINIRGCNIEPGFVDRMVHSRPRLRHIVPPDDVQYPSRQHNPFLRVLCPFCSM